MSRKFISVTEAMAMLVDGETVHCFKSPSPGMLLGADWSREQVQKAFEAGAPEIAGPAATAMNHAVCCGTAFFETKKQEDSK